MEENNYLVQLIEQYGLGWSWWTGVNDIRTESHYVYADGTPLLFINWRQYPHEPSDADHEDCAMTTKDLFWNDVRCSNTLNFICEYDN
ncbi:collectin-11-like [Saccoglossus kowalevskii]